MCGTMCMGTFAYTQKIWKHKMVNQYITHIRKKTTLLKISWDKGLKM